MKNSFVMYADWLDMISELDDACRSELLMAIMLYQNGQEVPEMNPATRVAFAQIKKQFKKDNEKYLETCEKRKAAGKKGGIAKASKTKQKLAKASKTKQKLAKASKTKQKLAKASKTKQNVADNDNENENDIKEHALTSMQEKQEQAFNDFWTLYPKKKSKGQAMKAWKKINPSSKTIRAIMDKLPELIESEEWKKDGGQFIPYPATWLNAGGWEDEVMDPPPKTGDKFNNFDNSSYDVDKLERALLMAQEG